MKHRFIVVIQQSAFYVIFHMHDFSWFYIVDPFLSLGGGSVVGDVEVERGLK